MWQIIAFNTEFMPNAKTKTGWSKTKNSRPIYSVTMLWGPINPFKIRVREFLWSWERTPTALIESFLKADDARHPLHGTRHVCKEGDRGLLTIGTWSTYEDRTRHLYLAPTIWEKSRRRGIVTVETWSNHDTSWRPPWPTPCVYFSLKTPDFCSFRVVSLLKAY